ncbi:hypothetical protein BD324DRAFT_614410 [Kockovaella imperatae]|uniref:RNA polymerase II-associated protein n=1 Tax=Kockovaella imperatae TaxID=4999 RepID=A0A1Y1UNN3_9TREE|nr:hypothetical protein BD324DRAFT_614410 [Kockovaella imperatae]ORX39629.1 hypothetical protein BD324DRAFT_614410 [Kockovaella imperatae]
MSEAVEGAPSSGRMWTIVGQGGLQIDLDLDTIGNEDVVDVLPDLLTDYAAELKDWTKMASEHWRQGRIRKAQDLLERGILFFKGGHGRPSDPFALLNLHSMMAHLHLSMARTAPKMAFQYAKYDKVDPKTPTKEWHFKEAAANLNSADSALHASGESLDNAPSSLAMGKILLYLGRNEPKTAAVMVERLLSRQPNNVLALLVQARLQFSRRAYESAFQTYTKLITYHPNMLPDPRIGLGLCAWSLGVKDRARAAWNRALQRDPQSWVALLLLGLASLNAAREPSKSQEEKLQLETEGVGYVQRAFKLNNKSPAAALALATVSGQGGQLPLASKLAERAIQYFDIKRQTALAFAERGRLGFMAGDVIDAGPFLAAAKNEEAGLNTMAELTLGQIAIKNGNLREALNFIEQTAKRINGPGPLEYSVLHASLLAYPHPGMKDDEIARNRHLARNMLSDIHQSVTTATTDEDWARLRGIGGDVDLFLDLARLWQDESLEKATEAYQTAVSIASDQSSRDASLDLKALRSASNLGALFHLQGNTESAEKMYEETLSKIPENEGTEYEYLRTVLAYNIARAFEEKGEITLASQWYRQILAKHPEHIESKLRLAMIASSAGRMIDAQILVKECLQAEESNLTVRSVYTNLLISSGNYREALSFASQTLNYDRSDPATFCSLGWIHYTLGREAKAPAEVAGRPKQWLRSAEAYQRALDLDPNCATAAQGLAIALTEDSLLLKSANPPLEGHRVKLAGQALGVFSRIADSITDGSVNVNMGHCYFTRGDEEKAIQQYEAALNAWKGNRVPILLYLSQAWYGYATKNANFSAMSKALSYSQQAMHVLPSDRAILYNIAMILQKGAELLQNLDPSKRTLEELHVSTKQAEQAATIFRSLADDQSKALPYDRTLAEQRALYGESLLRKAPEQIARQEAYEGEFQARVEEARKARAEEQARIQAAEAQRRQEIEAKAAELAETRRRAREEALAWQEELNARQAEEETRKAAVAEKKKARKEAGDIDSADEGVEPGMKRERKKRKKSTKQSRKIRSKSEISTDEDQRARLDRDDSEREGSLTPNEGAADEKEDEEVAQKRRARDQLAKLKAKRKSVKKHEDPDEEDGGGATATRKGGKQFKSKAFIEDSDEDAAEDDEPEAPTHPEEETRNVAENGMEVDQPDPAADSADSGKGKGKGDDDGDDDDDDDE